MPTVLEVCDSHEIHCLLSFIRGLFAHKNWQQLRFVIKSFPQTLCLNSESSFVALREKYRMSVQQFFFLNSELKFQFVLKWHILFLRQKHAKRKQLKELYHLWGNLTKTTITSTIFFTFYCLCLHLFHRQYLPTAHHFPIYTEHNFPFPSININATEWWKGSTSCGRDSKGFKWIKDKLKNNGRARCCLWVKGQQLHASKQEQ